MMFWEDQDYVKVEVWVGDRDDGFWHGGQSMGNHMEGWGWMGHKDYGLRNMEEEDTWHERQIFTFDFLGSRQNS